MAAGVRGLSCRITTTGWASNRSGRIWRGPRANWRLPRGSLNPKTKDKPELDVVRAVANARLSVGDALETLKLMGEHGR